MNTLNNKKRLMVLSLLVFFAPGFTSAANIFFETKTSTLSKNDNALIDVFLNTENDSINAVEGKVLFPKELLELKEIREGNSSVNFWLDKPHFIELGAIAFSGITAGGIRGPKIFLFSLAVHTKMSGSGQIESNSVRILKNDGKGTEAQLVNSPLSFSVSEESNAEATSLEVDDHTPPEDFKPIVAKDPNIFENKYFLVFAAQDKESGIDHFEVKEGAFGKWQIAESPYVLEDQSLKSKIYVKAVNKNKNERIVKLAAQNKTFWYLELVILAIILLAGTLILRNKLWPRPKK